MHPHTLFSRYAVALTYWLVWFRRFPHRPASLSPSVPLARSSTCLPHRPAARSSATASPKASRTPSPLVPFGYGGWWCCCWSVLSSSSLSSPLTPTFFVPILSRLRLACRAHEYSSSSSLLWTASTLAIESSTGVASAHTHLRSPPFRPPVPSSRERVSR